VISVSYMSNSAFNRSEGDLQVTLTERKYCFTVHQFVEYIRRANITNSQSLSYILIERGQFHVFNVRINTIKISDILEKKNYNFVLEDCKK
jgi:virulence-associated protein VapD